MVVEKQIFFVKERKKKKEKYAGIFPGYVILFSTRD